MGIFSFIEKGLGLRTGATAAARDAKELGENQLADEKAFLAELQGLYNPYIQRGEQASYDLDQFYSGNQQPIIDSAMNSPFYAQNIKTGEDAIARNRQATGGFRSGTTQENLAQNSQGVLQGLVQQMLQGKAGIADTGFSAIGNYGKQGSSMLSQIGSTAGEVATGGMNEAARQGQVKQGALSGGVDLLMGLFSDRQLKDNIKLLGDKNGLPWYSWDWNEKAENIGLTGSSTGHIADEVEVVRPDLIGERNGYKTVNYEGF